MSNYSTAGYHTHGYTAGVPGYGQHVGNSGYGVGANASQGSLKHTLLQVPVTCSTGRIDSLMLLLAYTSLSLVGMGAQYFSKGTFNIRCLHMGTNGMPCTHRCPLIPQNKAPMANSMVRCSLPGPWCRDPVHDPIGEVIVAAQAILEPVMNPRLMPWTKCKHVEVCLQSLGPKGFKKLFNNLPREFRVVVWEAPEDVITDVDTLPEGRKQEMQAKINSLRRERCSPLCSPSQREFWENESWTMTPMSRAVCKRFWELFRVLPITTTDPAKCSSWHRLEATVLKDAQFQRFCDGHPADLYRSRASLGGRTRKEGLTRQDVLPLQGLSGSRF